MRRLLLLCLLVMLPFQGVWSAVAGIAALDAPCAASQPRASHGDIRSPGGARPELQAHGPVDGHGAASDTSSAGMADCEGLAAEPCCDTHCSSCHEHALVAMLSVPVMIGACIVRGVATRSVSGAADHIPEHPLRPPLSRAA